LGQKVDALALIERADLAMYEAKRSGKNRFEIAA
jgi:PleD family two-component response regulator